MKRLSSKKQKKRKSGDDLPRDDAATPTQVLQFNEDQAGESPEIAQDRKKLPSQYPSQYNMIEITERERLFKERRFKIYTLPRQGGDIAKSEVTESNNPEKKLRASGYKSKTSENKGDKKTSAVQKSESTPKLEERGTFQERLPYVNDFNDFTAIKALYNRQPKKRRKKSVTSAR